MKAYLICTLLVLLLAACNSAPSETAVQTAIAQTATAKPPATLTDTPIPTDTPEPTSTTEPTPMETPEPTPTPIQLSAIDFQTAIFVEGDLPPRFTGSGIAQILPEALEESDFSSLVKVGRWRLFRDSDEAGTVTVLLFENVEEAQSAYAELVYDLDIEFSNTSETTTSSGTSYEAEVGETGFASEWHIISTGLGVTISNYEFAFVRCHAAVYIEFRPVPSMDTVQTYARLLDARLQEVVCE